METFQIILTAIVLGGMFIVIVQLRAVDKRAEERNREVVNAILGLNCKDKAEVHKIIYGPELAEASRTGFRGRSGVQPMERLELHRDALEERQSMALSRREIAEALRASRAEVPEPSEVITAEEVAAHVKATIEELPAIGGNDDQADDEETRVYVCDARGNFIQKGAEGVAGRGFAPASSAPTYEVAVKVKAHKQAVPWEAPRTGETIAAEPIRTAEEVRAEEIEAAGKETSREAFNGPITPTRPSAVPSVPEPSEAPSSAGKRPPPHRPPRKIK